MMLSLTPERMLALWKLTHGYEPLRSDASVVRSDGIDLDALLRLEMRRWYTDLLDNGPLHLLPVRDISGSSVAFDRTDSSVLLSVNRTLRRIVEVKLRGWNRPARIIGLDYDRRADILQAQASPYACAGANEPIAVIESHNTLRCYPPPAGTPAIAVLRAVVEPDNGLYEFDEAALPL